MDTTLLLGLIERKGSISMILRLYRYYCCTSLSLLLLLGVCSSSVHADGGAPQLAYVAGTTQGISVIDIAQRRATRPIAVVGDPGAILLSPDGQELYVTQPALGQVAVIAAKTGKTRCIAHVPGQPSRLALSLDATVLYVAGPGDTSVRALNPLTCAIQRTFQTDEPVAGLAVAAATAVNATPATPNQLWITGNTMLTVFAVDGRLLGTVPIVGGPQNISIPGGFTAYVTTRQGTVVAVDLNTRRAFRTLLRGGQFGTLDYDANTGEVYVPDEQHQQLDILTPVIAGTTVTAAEPERILHLRGSPQSVAITSDGQFGFVSLSNGQVAMLDIPGRSIVSSISVGGDPHFIITGLYPPANSPTSSSSQTAIQASSTVLSNLPLPLLIALFALVGVLVVGILWFVWRCSQKWFAG